MGWGESYWSHFFGQVNLKWILEVVLLNYDKMTNLLTKKWEIDNHLQGQSCKKRIYTLDELHETRREKFQARLETSPSKYSKDPKWSQNTWPTVNTGISHAISKDSIAN